MNKREVGNNWETRVIQYLEQNGVTITDRNYRSRNGEIDIIGRHDEYLVFFEVKYRSGTGSGYAAEAVTYAKQKQICKVADYYRTVHKIGDQCSIRYDVVAVQESTINWIQNAFPHIYAKTRYN